jgi:hypothetical protein
MTLLWLLSLWVPADGMNHVKDWKSMHHWCQCHTRKGALAISAEAADRQTLSSDKPGSALRAVSAARATSAAMWYGWHDQREHLTHCKVFAYPSYLTRQSQVLTPAEDLCYYALLHPCMLRLTLGCLADTDAAAVASARVRSSDSTRAPPSCCHPAAHCHAC